MKVSIVVINMEWYNVTMLISLVVMIAMFLNAIVAANFFSEGSWAFFISFIIGYIALLTLFITACIVVIHGTWVMVADAMPEPEEPPTYQEVVDSWRTKIPDCVPGQGLSHYELRPYNDRSEATLALQLDGWHDIEYKNRFMAPNELIAKC